MKYERLKSDIYRMGEYSIRSIKLEHMDAIRVWRNEQIDVLRQARPLTNADQQFYYHNTVLPSYSDPQTKLMLFSYFQNENLIGYGGLTNLDWINLRGEISFLLETSRSDKFEQEQYRYDFSIFLQLIKSVAFVELSLHRLFTETYEFRKLHISVLEQNGFMFEGRMRQHVRINGRFVDSLIHGCVKETNDV